MNKRHCKSIPVFQPINQIQHVKYTPERQTAQKTQEKK